MYRNDSIDITNITDDATEDLKKNTVKILSAVWNSALPLTAAIMCLTPQKAIY